VPVGGGDTQTGNVLGGKLMNLKRSQGTARGADGFGNDFSLAGVSFHSVLGGISGSLPALRQSWVRFFKPFTSALISA